MSVKDVDRGYRKIMDLFVTRPAQIAVGVLDDTKIYPDGTSVADVAAIHEFGLGVPERSFIRTWQETNGLQALDYLYNQMIASAERQDRSFNNAFEAFGLYCATGVQRRIESNQIMPPLAASTVKKKGFNTVLIDTELLVRSIDYKVTIK